jgi:Uncharacterized protein conserved in bacteria (DUF2272)/Domain of unknown function (DUF1906)
MTVIDTNNNVTGQIQELKNRGVTAVGRYYSSSSWKRLTRVEAVQLTDSGIGVFTVFENDGDPALTSDMGVHHGQLARQQAAGVGQPEGSAIYFALEHLPSGYTKKDIKGIRKYITGVRSVLDGHYKIGVYSDGIVCRSLLDEGLCEFTWLSASSSFEGSKQFYDSGDWSLAQKTPIDQDWDGISVDVNETSGDFGSFTSLTGAKTKPTAAKLAADVHAADADASPGFAGRVTLLAESEWKFFGRQTYDFKGHKDHAGHTEGEDGWYQRVGDYWVEGTNTHGIDGRNHDAYWSATFISWLMRNAGAGDRFRYSTQHSVYISQGIRDFLKKRDEAGYWTVRLGDEKPSVGDIVCWSRTTGIDYDHQNGGDYPGHADLVVEVAPDRVWIIGGNVGNSVTRRPLHLDPDGYLVPTVENGEVLFGLMKNRIA